MLADQSNGYQAKAEQFIALRTAGSIGSAIAREWAKDLPGSGSVLDLGCGSGVPISQTLMDAGFVACGVDASPRMVAAYRANFPSAMVECASVDDSDFFGRTFDGVIAWGLMFLLAPDAQGRLIHKVARALKPGGSFVFTAPWQECEWLDNLTGHTSVSLGAARYRQLLAAEHLVVSRECEDEGGNHYFFAT